MSDDASASSPLAGITDAAVGAFQPILDSLSLLEMDEKVMIALTVLPALSLAATLLGMLFSRLCGGAAAPGRGRTPSVLKKSITVSDLPKGKGAPKPKRGLPRSQTSGADLRKSVKSAV